MGRRQIPFENSPSTAAAPERMGHRHPPREISRRLIWDFFRFSGQLWDDPSGALFHCRCRWPSMMVLSAAGWFSLLRGGEACRRTCGHPGRIAPAAPWLRTGRRSRFQSGRGDRVRPHARASGTGHASTWSVRSPRAVPIRNRTLRPRFNP